MPGGPALRYGFRAGWLNTAGEQAGKSKGAEPNAEFPF